MYRIRAKARDKFSQLGAELACARTFSQRALLALLDAAFRSSGVIFANRLTWGFFHFARPNLPSMVRISCSESVSRQCGHEIRSSSEAQGMLPSCGKSGEISVAPGQSGLIEDFREARERKLKVANCRSMRYADWLDRVPTSGV
jgi:hypothetical protein